MANLPPVQTGDPHVSAHNAERAAINDLNDLVVANKTAAENDATAKADAAKADSATDAANKIAAHKTSPSAHSASVIDYSSGPSLPASTVEQAIDALDERTGLAQVLTTATSPDTLTETGMYLYNSSTGVLAANGFPEDIWAGIIEVHRLQTGSGIIVQIATSLYSTNGENATQGLRHYRTRVTNTWQPWMRMASDKTLRPRSLAVETDLNSVITPGTYRYSTTGATTALNWPLAGFQGIIEVHNITAGNVAIQRATLSTAQGGYPAGTTWTRGLHGTTWGAWQSTLVALLNHISSTDPHTQYSRKLGTTYTGDLNEAIVSGHYLVTYTATMMADQNAPINSGGWLEVLTQSANNILQRYTVVHPTSPDVVFHRTTTNGGTSWYPWGEVTEKHVTESDPHTQYKTRTATVFTGDLDDLLSGGDYAIGSAATNAPFTGGGHLMVIEGISTYRTQIMVGREASNQTHLWRRIRVGTTWYSWYQIPSTNTANIFSTTQTFENTGVAMAIRNTGSAADTGRYAVLVDQATGMLQFAPTTDAGTLAAAANRFFLRREGGFRTGKVDHLYGSGSPNGVLGAPVGSKYTDYEATAGAIEWVKTAGSGYTGWVVSFGNTGWRNVTSIVDPATIHPENTGGIYVARSGGTVYWRFDNLKLAAGSGTLVFMTDIPVEFRPASHVQGRVNRANSSAMIQNIWVAGGQIAWLSETSIGSAGATGTVRPDVGISGMFSYSVNFGAAWPSTLPGTA